MEILHLMQMQLGLYLHNQVSQVFQEYRANQFLAYQDSQVSQGLAEAEYQDSQVSQASQGIQYLGHRVIADSQDSRVNQYQEFLVGQVSQVSAGNKALQLILKAQFQLQAIYQH